MSVDTYLPILLYRLNTARCGILIVKAPYSSGLLQAEDDVLANVIMKSLRLEILLRDTDDDEEAFTCLLMRVITTLGTLKLLK